MQWASALSSQPDAGMALTELKRALSEQLDGARPDLVFAFVSPQYSSSYAAIPDLVHNHFSPACFIGCTAMGVIGGGREIEQHIAGNPAFSLTAAALPDVDIRAFHLESGDLPDADAGPEAWVEALGVPRQPRAHFLLLADPHSFDPQPLLMGLDFAYGDATKIGGLASAMEANCLFLDGESHGSGLVGLALQGDIEVDTVVAQGCRPIGEPMTITECRHNLIIQLDERPAAQVLVELFQTLSPEDQELLRHALHLGIASTEFKVKFEQGDFLIRNVLNLDQEKGFIAVGDVPRNGQTVQFHLRDARTAAEDLELMLGNYGRNPAPTAPSGALLFTCNGRGEYLFGQGNHDSGVFVDKVGEIPLGGFFCGGEIGQVGSSTYLHGYTCSFGIFRPLEG